MTYGGSSTRMETLARIAVAVLLAFIAIAILGAVAHKYMKVKPQSIVRMAVYR